MKREALSAKLEMLMTNLRNTVSTQNEVLLEELSRAQTIASGLATALDGDTHGAQDKILSAGVSDVNDVMLIYNNDTVRYGDLINALSSGSDTVSTSTGDEVEVELVIQTLGDQINQIQQCQIGLEILLNSANDSANDMLNSFNSSIDAAQLNTNPAGKAFQGQIASIIADPNSSAEYKATGLMALLGFPTGDELVAGVYDEVVNDVSVSGASPFKLMLNHWGEKLGQYATDLEVFGQSLSHAMIDSWDSLKSLSCGLLATALSAWAYVKDYYTNPYDLQSNDKFQVQSVANARAAYKIKRQTVVDYYQSPSVGAAEWDAFIDFYPSDQWLAISSPYGVYYYRTDPEKETLYMVKDTYIGGRSEHIKTPGNFDTGSVSYWLMSNIINDPADPIYASEVPFKLAAEDACRLAPMLDGVNENYFFYRAAVTKEAELALLLHRIMLLSMPADVEVEGAWAPYNLNPDRAEEVFQYLKYERENRTGPINNHHLYLLLTNFGNIDDAVNPGEDGFIEITDLQGTPQSMFIEDDPLSPDKISDYLCSMAYHFARVYALDQPARDKFFVKNSWYTLSLPLGRWNIIDDDAVAEALSNRWLGSIGALAGIAVGVIGARKLMKEKTKFKIDQYQHQAYGYALGTKGTAPTDEELTSFAKQELALNRKAILFGAGSSATTIAPELYSLKQSVESLQEIRNLIKRS